MKKIIAALILLGGTSAIYAAGGADTSLTVSSGTFLAIDLITNANGNNRQAITLGDGVNNQTQKVDNSSSAYVNLQEVAGSAISTTNPVPVQDTGTVTITGSISNTGFNVNNTPAVSQSGTWTVQPGNTQNSTSWLVTTTSTVNTSITNTPAVSQSGAWTVTNNQGTAGTQGWPVTSTSTVITGTLPAFAAPPAVSQSGTWTVQPGNTQNTTSWLVTTTSTVNTQTVGTTAVSISSVSGSALSLGSNTMANSLPVTLASNQAQFGTYITTTAVNSANTQIVITSTFSNVSASQTDQILVSTISTTNKICVHQLAVVAGGTATSVTFNTKPTGSGVAISPAFANGANGGEVLPFSYFPWFCTNVNASLSVTTGAGSTTGILIVYGSE